MKSLKTYTRPIVAGLAIASFLGSSLVAFAAPYDLETVHRDSSDTTDVPQNVTPPTYEDSSDYLLYFHGTGLHYANVGSGIVMAGGNIAVTPYSIETTDGHLSDTLGNIQSQLTVLSSSYTSLSSTIGALGAPLNINTFMANQASTTPLIATSTFNGFMSGAMVDKLTALSTTSPLKAYEGTTLRTGAFPIFKSATVSSGTAVVNLTTDGTSGGTSLCTGGVIADSVNPIVSDAAASYQMSWAFSNSNKTLTVTANKLTTANILTGLLGQTAANAAVVKVSAWCYA